MQRIAGALLFLLLAGCGRSPASTEARSPWRPVGLVQSELPWAPVTKTEKAPAPVGEPLEATLTAITSEKVVEEEIEEESEEIEEPPDDPIEHGELSLFLTLTDQESGQPVESSLQLWRLDAPGNADWARGDQTQAWAKISSEGGAIHQLPAGRYRIFFDAQRVGSEDPPEFVLRAPRTELHFALPMPRIHAARLSIFDESGHLVTHATRHSRWSSVSSVRVTPDWVRPRELRVGSGAIMLGGGIGCGGGRSRAVSMLADRDGFDLGLRTEDARTSRTTLHSSFAIEDRTNVSLALRCPAPGPWHYVAVTVPLAPLRDSIRVGGGALPPGAKFSAECTAVPAASADIRKLPIRIRVALPGYVRLDFEWHLGEALPLRELRPMSE